jgi:group I intron endonuclease
MGTNNNNKGSFVAVIVYDYVDINKSQILLDNKSKTGIYLWTHKESNKMYVGSAFDLSKRFRLYFSIAYMSKRKTSHIYNALLHHGYSTFSLSILEYIDISHFSKEEAQKLILEREQHFIDSLLPGYNILKIAGSTLGLKYSEDTKEKMRKPKTEEAKKNMSIAKSGENHPMFGKISYIAKSVYIYSLDNKLVKECSSITEAAEWLKSNRRTVRRHIVSNKVFNDKYIIRSS